MASEPCNGWKIELKLWTNLYNLRYADDNILMIDPERKFKELLNRLIDENKKKVLKSFLRRRDLWL